tara:strand:- start:6354 stop:7097 length:744 start_codon:yes stop_codon:yes gene_type:complete
MNQKVLIIGATSLLGRSLSYLYASEDKEIVLAGRDFDETKIISNDIGIRYGVNTYPVYLDVMDESACRNVPADILKDHGCPEIIIFVLGYIGNIEKSYMNIDEINKTTQINYSGIVSFLSGLIPSLEKKRNCKIAFVTSVAADRGRKSNFTYGAANASLNTYSQGLRAAMLQYDCSVHTIKLGYMDTRLAYGKTPEFMTCSTDYAARMIRKAIKNRKYIIYLPWFWRYIMLLLRLLPESIFIRLPLP